MFNKRLFIKNNRKIINFSGLFYNYRIYYFSQCNYYK